MKLIEKTSITNIPDSDIFDSSFLFPKTLSYSMKSSVKIINLAELLQHAKNTEIEPKLKEKPAMYANMYSAKSELEIFTVLFNDAIKNNKKIHITGITLGEEIEILEEYYERLGFMREDINCFRVDFSIPLITVSVNIENLMWKGSDYKAQKEKIFFMPPVRESSQNKAMFKGINRGVIAGIHIQNFGLAEKQFLADCITQEKILPLTLGKVLFYNLEDIGISSSKEKFELKY